MLTERSYLACEDPYIKITEIYGECPVQAEGWIENEAFYFRSRGGRWSIEIGSEGEEWTFSAPLLDLFPQKEPIYEDNKENEIACYETMHFGAGQIDYSTVETLIYTAASFYKNEKMLKQERDEALIYLENVKKFLSRVNPELDGTSHNDLQMAKDMAANGIAKIEGEQT